MTKGEMLRFLEPFTDDIRIFVESHLGDLENPAPKYFVVPSAESAGILMKEDLLTTGLSHGEGYVVL